MTSHLLRNWPFKWSPSDKTTYLGYETTPVIFLSHKFIFSNFEFRIYFCVDVHSYCIQLSQEEQDDYIGHALKLAKGAAKLRRPKRTVCKLRSFPENHQNAVLKKNLSEKIMRPGDVGMYPVTVCLGGSCHRREFWKLWDFLRTWKQIVKAQKPSRMETYMRPDPHENPGCEPKIYVREIHIGRLLGLSPLGISWGFISLATWSQLWPWDLLCWVRCKQKL